MALGFIKKIFSFGKDHPASDAAEAVNEEQAIRPDELPAEVAPPETPEPASDRDLLLEEAEAANPEVDLHRTELQAGIYPLPPVDHPAPAASDQTSAAPGAGDIDAGVPEPHAALSPEAETTRAAELVNIGMGGVEHAHEEIAAREAAMAPAPEPTGDLSPQMAAEDASVAETEPDTADPEPAAHEIPAPEAPPQPATAVSEEPDPAEAIVPEAQLADRQLDETVLEAEEVAPALPKGFSTARHKPEEQEAPQQAPKRSWLQRLRLGLARTSSHLTGQITGLFTKRKLDDATLQDLEDLLIQADLGVETALRITDTLAAERYGKDVTGTDVGRIMAGEITKVLEPVAKPLELDLSHKPHVILVVGVNGTGKTTTIGKLAAKLSGAGLKVMMAAGDTFRAAAIEQLHIWAERTGSDIVSSRLGADAAGLAYEAYEQAKEKKSDVLIIDTAGRLQNKSELMAELEKIVRVLGKLDPDAPHTVLQTLDATTGQNAMNQVEIFRNVAGVSGLIMTKLDGTARGGILVAIAAKHKLPVYFIGVGEGIDDLEPFEARDFAQAIAGVEA
ncbi:signal recognition particle-docking protein FtsY [Mycoplana dimorpha]|uniref:Signal recognition particle receptor FtsY n=1 Tax=Mycoplana dimorpha TaxID=28320 RepID=A0A2T5BBF1_MYCDI|nr:signal recognition particle-docking protein FtsY [Mycoplana dimorpha]PTM96302.1 signal recognition particle-docking protein FtsY [Mycoplana dimorpha]